LRRNQRLFLTRASRNYRESADCQDRPAFSPLKRGL